METFDSRLVVIRAWCEADRIIIRLIASSGPAGPPVEWVFVDIRSAGERLAAVLGELLPPTAAPSAARPAQPMSADRETKR